VPEQRQPAAIYVRARDIRNGDVIVGGGRVKAGPNTIEYGRIWVSLARSANSSRTYAPDDMVLIEVDHA
jgi:hypothetical protein